MANLNEFSPVHYTGNRHFWNNGFRQMWLANGKRDANVINAARAGDIDTVIDRVRAMGGVRGGIGIAKSIIAAAQKLAADVPAYKVQRDGGCVMVCTPHVSWQFRGRRQVGVIEWLPMFGVRKAA